MKALSSSVKVLRVSFCSRRSEIRRLSKRSCRRRLPSWYMMLSDTGHLHRGLYGLGAIGSLVPGLHDRLPNDLAVPQLEHRKAEYLRAVRVGTGLRERHPVFLGSAEAHLMGHGTAADVVPEIRDRRFAVDFARPAGRIIAVDDAQACIVGIETCQLRSVATLDGVLDRCARD